MNNVSIKSNYKIVLINPRIESYSSTLPPLGLLYIASVLERDGFLVQLFDIYPYDDRDIPLLLNANPDVIGMTILTDYWERAVFISNIINKHLPGSTFIIGGVHVTALPEESMTKIGADIGVLGEGELTMLDLCRKLQSGTDWHDTKGIIFRNNAKTFVKTDPMPYIDDLDSLPHPARHLLDFNKYLVPPGIIRGQWSERSTTIMTSRGCPFQCIWCGSNCTFGRKVRYRGVNNVIDEIKLLISKYRIDTIWFVDDTFTLNKKRVIEFCNSVIKNNIQFKWGCQAHIKTADEEMFRSMKKAGCVQLDFGVESGSNRVLRSLNKNSDADSIKKAFQICKKIGMRTAATFIFGSPSEKEEDVEATLRLAKEIYPNFVSSFFITPYPGTALMDIAIKNDWILPSERQNYGLKKRPSLKIYFSEEELYSIRKRFQKAFTYRNFSSVFFNPVYMAKAINLVCRNPAGILSGIKKFSKTKVFDDFIFEFLIHYTKNR